MVRERRPRWAVIGHHGLATTEEARHKHKEVSDRGIGFGIVRTLGCLLMAWLESGTEIGGK